MSDALAIALTSTIGVVLVALIGVLIELVRTRRKTDTVAREMAPNHGSSMRDALDRVEVKMSDQGERLAAIETHIGLNRPRRRGLFY